MLEVPKSRYKRWRDGAFIYLHTCTDPALYKSKLQSFSFTPNSVVTFYFCFYVPFFFLFLVFLFVLPSVISFTVLVNAPWAPVGCCKGPYRYMLMS